MGQGCPGLALGLRPVLRLIAWTAAWLGSLLTFATAGRQREYLPPLLLLFLGSHRTAGVQAQTKELANLVRAPRV